MYVFIRIIAKERTLGEDFGTSYSFNWPMPPKVYPMDAHIEFLLLPQIRARSSVSSASFFLLFVSHLVPKHNCISSSLSSTGKDLGARLFIHLSQPIEEGSLATPVVLCQLSAPGS